MLALFTEIFVEYPEMVSLRQHPNNILDQLK